MSYNLKRYETYKYDGYENYQNDIGFMSGHRVIIKYKRDRENYLKKGIISYITNGINKGDCRITLDDGRDVTYYYTNLERIMSVVIIETGEVFDIELNDFQELSTEGIIKYNNSKKMYYCEENDKWQIENYSV